MKELYKIGIYFPRFDWSYLAVYFAVVIKYLAKYLTICLLLSCAKEAIALVPYPGRDYL